MCHAAAKTVGQVFAEIIPDVKEILTISGQVNTPAGQALLAELAQASTALENWTPGTTGDDVIQVLNALNAGFAALPGVPPQYALLASTIEAGIVTVISIIQANEAHASGDTAAAEAHAESAKVAVAQKIGYHVSVFTMAKATIDPSTAAKEYAKASKKAHAAITPTQS